MHRYLVTLASEELVSREVGKLNAHDIGRQSDWTFLVCHSRREPSCIDGLSTPHARLGQHYPSYSRVRSTIQGLGTLSLP